MKNCDKPHFLGQTKQRDFLGYFIPRLNGGLQRAIKAASQREALIARKERRRLREKISMKITKREEYAIIETGNF